MINETEKEYIKVRLEFIKRLLEFNSVSSFTGKMEVWFENGYIRDIHNNQYFAGTSFLDISVVGGSIGQTTEIVK